MSGQKFDNKIIQWLDDRLPIFSVLQHSAVEYPTPKNLNYWWNFGSLAGFMLVPLHMGLLLYRARLEETRLAARSPEYEAYRRRTGFIFPKFGQ